MPINAMGSAKTGVVGDVPPPVLRGPFLNILVQLDVEPQDVVLGQAESADGCLTIDTCVGPVPIVAMQPGRQFGFSLT
jgi:hypothetical protein